MNSPDIAVIIPAYNEAPTIADVITAFARELPAAQIWVCNNNSRDSTAQIAADTIRSLQVRGGVLHESRQGKAFAVRHTVHSIDADIFVMVDGDTTYPADAVHTLIEPVLENKADMVVGDRLSGGHYGRENKRMFHGFGNRLVLALINGLFNARLSDVMSGYRVMTRQFITTYPILIDGFEIETDMTLHALHKRFRVIELPIDYRDRPEGSFSKLNTLADGFRVLKTIFSIFRNYKPLVFFSFVSLLFFIMGLSAGAVPVIEFARTRFITHVPLAILATGMELAAMVLLAVALILDTVSHQARIEFELRLLQGATARSKRVDQETRSSPATVSA